PWPVVIIRFEDDLVTDPADQHRIAKETEFLRQAHGLAAAVPEKLCALFLTLFDLGRLLSHNSYHDIYHALSGRHRSIRARLACRGAPGLRDERGAQLRLQQRVLVEVREHLVAALADLLAAVRVPGAGLLDETELLGGVDQLA